MRTQRIIAQELDRLGWITEQLMARRKNNPAKLAIAARLQRDDTHHQSYQRLYLGRVNTAKTNLHCANKGPFMSEQA